MKMKLANVNSYKRLAIKQANQNNVNDTVSKLKGMGDFVRYRALVSSVRDCHWVDTPENGSSSIGYGKWDCLKKHDAPKPTDLFIPEYFTYSDYSGSLVEKSNLEVFLETFDKIEGVYETFGGYGTRGLAIRLDAINQEMIDIFNSLQNYPLIDEDHHSKLEWEQESEAWDDWLKKDFTRAIEKKFDIEDLDEVCSDIYGLYRLLCERSNTYGHSESAISWYIDLDPIVNDCLESDLQMDEAE